MVADALEIQLEGRTIGALTALGGDRSILTFTDAYAEDPDRPLLSLGLRNAQGALLTDHAVVQTRVHPFFSNLLPEGGLRDYLARRAGVKAVREYALLQVLGSDLPGGVTLVPVGERRADKEEPAISDRAGQAGGPLRFSLAGVQLKFSASLEGRDRLTIPASGAGGDWIVKLPSPRWDGVAENEFSMMTLASAVGLDAPEVRLTGLDAIEGLPADVGRGAGQAFAVRRFDREADGRRVHIEDFAQVFGVYPEEKYERARYRSILRVLWHEIGEAAAREFIGRLVFNTLIGNADMHLKNWSLIYPDGRTPSLAPGYDFLTTTTYIPDENAALRYETTRRMAGFGAEELVRMAARAGVPETMALDAGRWMVQRFQDVWAAQKANLPLSAAIREEVDSRLRVLPIAALR
ncbi:type II toxin-antitoxin system HipA family toxin [Brevundimonas sp. S30B]|uniref:type II toxin-antitoxin system HipA family toxin n=1 Tax=unclassified Brevundimonas TaxID=2622653 RepID=UPI0010726B8A|nr:MULTISPECIES: HipA domain-containing protein [unclassified Brevundimonas]QBX37848.1 type II toxin-antitoxin system HipA family toxin [Brevundimonas sp. MF30-B]TFW02796.1 type II toxin-antitoxin system HipA family toxin [Brevundimonas sp. S30B]